MAPQTWHLKICHAEQWKMQLLCRSFRGEVAHFSAGEKIFNFLQRENVYCATFFCYHGACFDMHSRFFWGKGVSELCKKLPQQNNTMYKLSKRQGWFPKLQALTFHFSHFIFIHLVSKCKCEVRMKCEVWTWSWQFPVDWELQFPFAINGGDRKFMQKMQKKPWFSAKFS